MSDNKKKLFEMNVVNFNQGIEDESFLLNSRNNGRENLKTMTEDEVNNNCKKIHRFKENSNENLKPSVSGCTFLNNKRYRRIGVKKSLRMLKCYKMLIGILVNGACEYLLTKLIRRTSKLEKIRKGSKFEKTKFFKKNYAGDKIRVSRRNENKHDEDLENRKEISRPDTNSDKIDGNLIASIGPDIASLKDGFDNYQGKIYNKEYSKTRNRDVIIDETPVDSFETIARSFNEIDNEILRKECTDKYEVYHFDDYPFQEETLIISERENERFVTFSKSTEDLFGEGGRDLENVEKVSLSRSQKSCTGKREKNLNNFKETEIQKISEYIDDKDPDKEISAFGKSLSKLNGDDKRNNKMINNEGVSADNNTINETKNSIKKISNVIKNSSIKSSQASKKIEETEYGRKLSLVGIKKPKKHYSPIKLLDNNETNKKKKKNKAKKIINVLSSADLSLQSKDSRKNDSNFVLFSRYSIPVSIELNRISKNLRELISKKNLIQTKITSYFPVLPRIVSRKEDTPVIGFNKMKEKNSNLRNDDDDNNKKENNEVIIEDENNMKKEKTDQQRLLPIIESDIILKNPKKLVYSKNENDYKTANISFPRLTNVRGNELTKKLSTNKMKKLSKIELCRRSDIIEDSDTSTEKTTVIPPSYSIFSNDQGGRRPILDMNIGLLDSQQREDLLAPWETVDIYEKVNRWHEDTFEP